MHLGYELVDLNTSFLWFNYIHRRSNSISLFFSFLVINYRSGDNKGDDDWINRLDQAKYKMEILPPPTELMIIALLGPSVEDSLLDGSGLACMSRPFVVSTGFAAIVD
jgi:hypothetical protein